MEVCTLSFCGQRYSSFIYSGVDTLDLCQVYYPNYDNPVATLRMCGQCAMLVKDTDSYDTED